MILEIQSRDSVQSCRKTGRFLGILPYHYHHHYYRYTTMDIQALLSTPKPLEFSRFLTLSVTITLTSRDATALATYKCQEYLVE